MTNETPPTVAERFARAERPLTAVIDAVGPNAWDQPSPCPGWSARDVVAHVVSAERSFLTGRGIDLGPEPDLEADPASAWHAHVDEVRPLLADPAVVDREFEGHFGPTTVGDSFVRFYLFDLVAHRWDLARAVGGDDQLTDDEMDQLEAQIDGFGEAAYMEGVFVPGVVAPEGADRQTRVLARLGRVA